MHIHIRQSGGANIVSLPKAILRTLNLHAGSLLDISVEDHKIVLTPSDEKITLEALLTASPKAFFKRTEEDNTWLNDKPRGEEY